MDHSYPYIASLTREPFLFYEMRSTAKIMSEGISDDAIVKKNVEQNLFQYPTLRGIDFNFTEGVPTMCKTAGTFTRCSIGFILSFQSLSANA